MAGTFDFSIYNGEDFDKTMTWSTSSTPVSQGGIPVNLSSYLGAALTLGTVEDFITTTSGANGLITLGGSAGTVRVFIPAAIATQFTGTSITYRLFLTNSASETTCLLAGNFRVKP